MASLESVLMSMQLWRDAGLGASGGWPTTDADWERRARLWEAMLFDVSDDELMRLALGHIETGTRWAPTPGELLQARGVDTREHWESGWDLLIKKINFYNPPERYSDHPPQEEAIRRGIAAIGGHRAACHMQTGDPAARAAFRDAYLRSIDATRVKSSRDRAALTAKVMAGQLTADDAREAMDPSTPALRVLEGGR